MNNNGSYTHQYLSRTETTSKIPNVSYNIVTVEGAATSRVFFHLKAEAVIYSAIKQS